jgi:hypothetical protein
MYFDAEEVIVVNNSGWIFVSGSRSGWVATKVGQELTFVLNVPEVTEVTIIYLMSYENIGNCVAFFDSMESPSFTLSGQLPADSLLHSEAIPISLTAGNHTLTVRYTTAPAKSTASHTYAFRVAGIGYR